MRLLAATCHALGETTIERGDYLVNTITACGNCHSPRKAEGRIIADKALSGGLTFDTPTFVTTAPNITPDRETGIGSWSDAEIKRLLVEGVRPDHGRPPGTQLAAMMPANFYKALLPDDLAAVVAYLRSIKPVRNEVAVPVHKLPIHRDAYPEAEAGFSQAMMTNPVQHGAYLAAIGHCIELSPGVLARRQRFQDRARQGRPRLPVARRRARQPNQRRCQHHLASDRRHRRLERCGNRPRHPERLRRDGRALQPPMAFGFYAGIRESGVKDIIAHFALRAAA